MNTEGIRGWHKQRQDRNSVILLVDCVEGLFAVADDTATTKVVHFAADGTVEVRWPLGPTPERPGPIRISSLMLPKENVLYIKFYSL